MIFTITTPKGSQIEIDTDKIEGVEVELDGERFDISIKKL